MFDHRNISIQQATGSVHDTLRIIDGQMKAMDEQMKALGGFMAKARSQNSCYHKANLSSLDTITANVRESCSMIDNYLSGFGDRIDQLQGDALRRKTELNGSTLSLSDEARKPLSNLRVNIQNRPLKKYITTGLMPRKRTYEYSSNLPRTEAHETILSKFRDSRALVTLPLNSAEQVSPLNSFAVVSPSKGFVYIDGEKEGTQISPSTVDSSKAGLREVDVNVMKPLKSDTDEDDTGDRLSANAVKLSKLDAGSVLGNEKYTPSPFKRASSLKCCHGQYQIAAESTYQRKIQRADSIKKQHASYC